MQKMVKMAFVVYDFETMEESGAIFYLGVLCGGTVHNVNVPGPLAENYNCHGPEILMCQRPPTHEGQSDLYLVGVENFDKEGEAKERAQFSV